ncbi:type VI secretion system protein TssA [Malonomonas rubra]|uniref:type VI secretion system protein TssA n=1 Tax=Malonomonas rubra TaxID=57040 RepID=UPI0026E9AE2E|nr:type VI secretion system protein TssA [Malonomonas rubra]
MQFVIDVNDILTPIPGDNPSGADLRYEAVYDEIKDARKADDELERGDWQRDLKSSDWNKVIQLAAEALAKKSKDLQLAAWLTEGLVNVDGFEGLAVGLQVVNGLLQEFWETLYPEIDDGDLDYRAGRLAFLNDNLWLSIKQIPLTDKSKTTPYSWLEWHESREVGYEKDLVAADGTVDEKRQQNRSEAIADGKLAPEEFDNALAYTDENFIRAQLLALQDSQQEFIRLDEQVDEKFGDQGPSLAQLRETLEDCEKFFQRLFKEKGWSLEEEAAPDEDSAGEVENIPEQPDEVEEPAMEEEIAAPSQPEKVQKKAPLPADGQEESVWSEALSLLRPNNIDAALALLFEASCSALSIRQKHRYRLLMARLCLKANRVDLAKPILEELNTLIEELNLKLWEAPTWIGEVIEGLYLCLTNPDERFQDLDRAAELLKVLCTTDVTKATKYKQ